MSLYCSTCGVANSIGSGTCKKCGATLFRPERSENPVKAEIVNDNNNHEGGWPKNPLFNVAIAIICAVYIINPTAGMIEIIPDVIPIVGNLDEAAATAGLLTALSYLGVNPFWRKEN